MSLLCTVGQEGSHGITRSKALSAYLDPYPMIHTQPEEQQGTQEQRLEEVVQHPREPAVHQEGEREERVWKGEDLTLSRTQKAGRQQRPWPLLSSLGLTIKISPGQSSRAGSKPKAILFSECLKGMEQIATVILTESHLPLCQLLLQPENSQHHSKRFLEEGQRNRQPRGHLSQVPRLLSLQLVHLSTRAVVSL